MKGKASETKGEKAFKGSRKNREGLPYICMQAKQRI